MDISKGKYWKLPWNPVTGCTPVSAGCDNCWANEMYTRFKKDYSIIKLHSERLSIPRKTKKSTVFFVCNTSDLFHHDISPDSCQIIFNIMANHNRHTFLVLTKRASALRKFHQVNHGTYINYENIWNGVTVESDDYIHRIGSLRNSFTQNQWISFEPLLDSVRGIESYLKDQINQVIVGCESGPKRRPCKLEWIADIVEQCRVADVPCFVKQIPDKNGKVIKSFDHSDWPDELKIRNLAWMPTEKAR